MQQYTPFLLIGLFFVAVIVIGYFASKAEKARKAAIGIKLQSLGFQFAEGPATVPAILKVLSNLAELRNGAQGVVWGAIATPPNGLHTIIFEHRFVTGSGKNRTTHHHTVVATVCPQDWWRFSLKPENFFQRLGDSWGLTKDVNLENETFNKRWRLRCENDDSTALVVLTPEVQAVLQNAPPAEWWSVGRGTFACCWRRHLKDTELDSLLQRLGQVVQALNPEVRAMLETAEPN